jgi:hypothetical protein
MFANMNVNAPHKVNFKADGRKDNLQLKAIMN